MTTGILIYLCVYFFMVASMYSARNNELTGNTERDKKTAGVMATFFSVVVILMMVAALAYVLGYAISLVM